MLLSVVRGTVTKGGPAVAVVGEINAIDESGMPSVTEYGIPLPVDKPPGGARIELCSDAVVRDPETVERAESLNVTGVTEPGVTMLVIGAESAGSRVYTLTLSMSQ